MPAATGVTAFRDTALNRTEQATANFGRSTAPRLSQHGMLSLEALGQLGQLALGLLEAGAHRLQPIAGKEHPNKRVHHPSDLDFLKPLLLELVQFLSNVLHDILRGGIVAVKEELTRIRTFFCGSQAKPS